MNRQRVAALLLVVAGAVGTGAQAARPPGGPAGDAAPGAAGTDAPALEMSPAWIQLLPAVTFPVAGSTGYFATGGGGTIVGELRPAKLPLAVLRAQLGYSYQPILASQSVSFTSLGLGAGIAYNIVPRMGVKAYADAGVTYGFFNSSLEGYWNPYVKAGVDLYACFPPRLTVGLGGVFLYEVGLYTGVGATAGVSIGLGTPVVVQRFSPRRPAGEGPQPLPQERTIKPGGGLEPVRLRIQDIYPVFYKHYDTSPIGSVTLHNWEKTAVEDVVVEVLIRDYMGDPRQVKGPGRIEPGADAEVPLFALLRREVLANTEDTKVAAAVTVRYTLGGKPGSRQTVQTVKVLKRNALTWDDDRKAAAYVSANDPSAAKFARNTAAIVREKGNLAVDPGVRIASALHNALSLYGLTYTASPVPTLNADAKTVDHIQFPQQTLEYRSGKCSDFSALYASLFEALGVETAFITIPGHIYVAIALTIGPDDARASFAHRDDLIFSGNKAWLPIEITLREGGLLAAWQRGAREWRENLARGQAALLPVREAWSLYEPVGFSTGALDLQPVPADQLVKAFTADIDAFVRDEMGPQEKLLLAAVAASAQAGRSKALNSLAVLHSRFGLYSQAQKEFEEVLAREQYVPAMVNLGHLWYRQGRYESALELYERAAKQSPRNPGVLLGVARAHHAMENYASAKKAYAELMTVSPSLAATYAYLDLRGDEATRAADAAGVRGTLPWQE